MAAQVDESTLLGDIDKRTKGAFGASKSKAPAPRGVGLPGGIIGGVGRLTSYKLDKNDKGIPYLLLGATCAEPLDHKGTRFNVTYRFEDQERKSASEVMAELCNDLQLMGAKLSDAANLKQMMVEVRRLVSENTPFTFNTRAWSFNGRSGVTTYIQGGANNISSTSEQVIGGPVEPDSPPETASEEFTEDTSEEFAEDTGGEEPWKPAVDEIYGFKPNAKSAVMDFKVIAVDEDAQQVNLSSLDGKKKFSKIPWDKLQNASE